MTKNKGMKKIILLFIAILSFSACSTTDDYGCYEGYVNTYDLRPSANIDPRDLIVHGLKGNEYTVIRSQREFRDRVKDARYFENQIDFSRYDLIIGQVYIKNRNVKVETILTQFCNYSNQVLLEVKLYNNRQRYEDFITYNAIVPKLRTDDVIVDTIIYE